MPKILVDLDESVVAILEGVAVRLKLPEGLLPEEAIELAITALANSYDTGNEEESVGAGEPIDAKKLHEILNTTLNPNISTDFTQPAGIAAPRPGLIFEDIEKLAPSNNLVKLVQEMPADNTIDKVVIERTKQAITAVFGAIPKSRWDTEDTKELVAKTIVTLMRPSA